MGDTFKQAEATSATGKAARGGVLYFTTRLLPWLLGAAMLGVFLITLNHWIAPEGIGLAAELEGMTWARHLTTPVTFFVTRPIGWLPVARVPLALNLLTAACAAVSLGFLARAVALLPHDLSQNAPPPRRGFEPPKLLASRLAWVPPLFAVLVCGLQLTFWENSITATGQMITLLLFAYTFRCFLEYNASGRDSWLLRGAAVNGLAVANDPMMVMFIPIFLLGLIWVKRLFGIRQQQLEQLLERRSSFKLELLWQLPACWLAGFAIVLVLPIVAALATNGHVDFWVTLKHLFQSYGAAVRINHQFLITSLLICVVPIFLIGLRYYHFLEGTREWHLFLGTTAFQFVYGFFLLVILWTMFDTPLSPHRQAPSMNTLPLYFLECLSIGFFIGHFLMTGESSDFGLAGERRRSTSGRQGKQALVLASQIIKWASLAGVVALIAVVPAALIYKNLPAVNLIRHSPSGEYIATVGQALPENGAVVFGTDTAELALLQARLNQEGRQKKFLLINVPLLAQNTNYWTFLKAQKNPRFNLDLKLPPQLPPETLKLLPVTVLQELSRSNAVYCLPPAPIDDFIAELFYYEPEGLVDRAEHYHLDDAFASPAPPQLYQENETFWRNFQNGPFTNLVTRINPPARIPASSMVQRFVNTLRFWPEADEDSLIAGKFYSVALNDWGVTLQQKNELAAAGECFTNALRLNPANDAAQINEDFNADLQAHRDRTIQTPLDTVQSMNKYRDWRLVAAQGMVDEPNFCYMRGTILAINRLLRPAIAQLERAKQLSPASLEINVTLGRLFVECHDVTNSLVAANDILAISPTNVTGLFIKSNSEIRMEDYKDAIPLLNQVLAEEPTNVLARLNRAVAYRSSYLFKPARQDYEGVLAVNPTAFPAYYDLAQMDDAEANLQGAITNYELFIKYAPTNVAELPAAMARLKVLQTPNIPTDNSGPLR